ncbi:type VII secretion integral membrane protein EccD [Mycolicibacterium brumae]|uniref:Type VII secretion integral membrane protein EccD n=1 Tax=Mycolicibacterium brumae TaxID=85968 RepID=A0A2G5PFL0_9MYCO|nr:type VII secretion integral membrane protein EccD [Mycolicibacterium brumae]MCV7194257.1 type VII secretion integral membrane protein EccD [Mycolicibacterium brumae]PIB77107.1 type VII secretion integral membrane protein EccD [Mycolicibacterium brumae]RWA19263.1 hypothetical protein MBRU_17040 [Mycolicibacterium brumae DSM 44177]UWW10444.1 type VII secretion integral membrane protein EccD3 [Mycolicibacterium brumae]
MTQALDNPASPAPVLPIVRVAILAERRIVEIALPTEAPLREIMPAVLRLVAADPESGEDAAEPDETSRRMSLAPIGGAAYSLDASLDTVGVVDGDLLALVPVSTGPAAPGVVEDIADAAVIFSASRRRGWGLTDIRRLARAAAIVLLLAATGVAVAHRLTADNALGLYAVSALAAVAVIAALALRGKADELAIAAVVPIAAAFMLAVPGSFGAPQVLLGAAGVTAWALVNVFLSTRWTGFFTAATVIGGGLTVAAAVSALWPSLTLASLGAGLIVIGLLVTVQAAGLSAMWARLPLPVIPAPGDPIPSAPARSVLADLPRRVRRADAHQTGFIAAGVLLGVLGSLAVLLPVTGQPAAGGWSVYLVVAISLGSVLRARVWDTAACKAWLLSQPYLLGVALLAAFVAGGRYVPARWVLGVLALATLVWVVVAANPKLAEPESYSLPARRVTGFLASALDASIIPVVAYLVGIFAWVLNR